MSIRSPLARAVARPVAATAAAAVLLFAGGSAASAATPAATSSKAATLHDGMRRLWEDHGTYTRLVIDSFVDGSPSLKAYETRLLANQTDIGNAIKPYYGAAAGAKLTQLLRGHILGAVTVLQAAKSGNAKALAKAKAAWYANGNQIADFLSKANPKNWPESAVRAMLKAHLDQVIQQAVDELGHNPAASVRDYDTYIDHIMVMADTLSGGIVKQFPKSFTS
jgi:hypothetical protein